ncbi:SDR family NAD(P)-dependent oxidoreductase [Azospirillum sp.]|uniref:SDR family NAD(P)-dependent oxidoreductase n=1 Tax=Azospirillum sp. TaxID=34012 RepID=UPI003D7480E8
MTAKPFERCSALLTGATSGIGLATAKALAAAGVPRIAVNGRNAERGAAAVAAIRGVVPAAEVRFCPADVTRADTVREMVDGVAAGFGGLDLVMNCAGGNHPPALFHGTDPAQFPDVVASSLFGILHTCHAALPHLKRAGGGAIVNTASDAARVPTPGEALIGGMMAAIVMFSRTLAAEAARDGIRVNVLTPSLVEGTRTYDMVMADPFAQRLFAKAVPRARLGLAQPEDQAALAVFLMSPAAARMTGQAISLNGGIST